MFSNMAQFDWVVSVIFSLLYRSFPTPRELDFQSVYQESQKYKLNHSFSMSAHDAATYISIVLWLRDAGYIALSDELLGDVVLTAKGLETLRSEHSGAPLGEQISKGLNGDLSELQRLIGRALGIGVRLSIR